MGISFVLINVGNLNEEATSNYQSIKLLCECKYGKPCFDFERTVIKSILGVLSQFVRYKSVNLDLDAQKRGKNSFDVSHGLWLKLNEKLGGTNWKVDVPLSCLGDVPIMFVGCSFTHAKPKATDPTVVAFSASLGPGKNDK